MRIAVKLGGSLLETAESRANLAGQIASLAGHHSVIVIHGGGKQMTRFLAGRGVESQFAKGLRVSDATVIDAALHVIAGSVNKQLTASLIGAGCPALGLSGVDGLLTEAEQMDKDLGFVGRPMRSSSRLLATLIDSGYVPVIACVAADAKGRIYNVNADAMAVSCALAFRAEALIFLTDVAGVKGASGTVLSQLAAEEISPLIASGVANGGMQAKLESAALALNGGVHEVSIAAGDVPAVLGAILNGSGPGTRVTTGAQLGAAQ